MNKAQINQNQCDHSPACPCTRSRPAGAIQDHRVDPGLCAGCGVCVDTCPAVLLQ